LPTSTICSAQVAGAVWLTLASVSLVEQPSVLRSGGDEAIIRIDQQEARWARSASVRSRDNAAGLLLHG